MYRSLVKVFFPVLHSLLVIFVSFFSRSHFNPLYYSIAYNRPSSIETSKQANTQGYNLAIDEMKCDTTFTLLFLRRR